MHIQHWSLRFILHEILKTKHVLRRLIKSTWWVMSVILAMVKIPPSFGVNSLAVGFLCRYINARIFFPIICLYQEPGKTPPPYLVSPLYIGISPWETYIVPSANPYMVGSIDDAGGFKPYLWNLWQCIHPLSLK